MPTEQAMIQVIAEKVMGWKQPRGCDGWYKRTSKGKYYKTVGGDWNPFTSWAFAGEVLEALQQRVGVVVSVNVGTCTAIVNIHNNETPSVSEPKGPYFVQRSISRAAYEWAMRGEKNA